MRFRKNMNDFKENIFGTDGIRGHIDSPALRPENFTKLGRVLGGVINASDKNKLVFLATDSRSSGDYLQNALALGLCETGINCHFLGVITSGALANLTRNSKASFGFMISASHNPACDNGVKFFDSEGFKISEPEEQMLQQAFNEYEPDKNPENINRGELLHNHEMVSQYVDFIRSNSNFKFIKPLKIVIDCANGASSFIAQKIFNNPNITVEFLSNQPDGKNINLNCGSEYPALLQDRVTKTKADLGIAFDGDGDRVLFVDNTGTVIDGDACLALFAKYFKQLAMLKNNAMVSTVMSSLSLDQALKPDEISVHKTKVGDKYVARYLLENNLSFGGENSGHLLLLPKSCSGDGLFFAVQFLNLLSFYKQSAQSLVSFYQESPRTLKNILIRKKIPLNEMPRTQKRVQKVEETLGEQGRVLLRYSGTEAKLRILVEAQNQEQCQKLAEDIAQEFLEELNSLL